MNLREVREAADFVNRHQMFVRDCKHLYNAHQQCQWCHSGRYYIESAAMAQHILATIDPSPGLPITADWLREEWGFEEIGVMDSDKFYLDHDYSHYLIILKDGIGVFYFDCDDGDLWPHDLHTRQQFCDLARCLGIPRRKDGKR